MTTLVQPVAETNSTTNATTNKCYGCSPMVCDSVGATKTKCGYSEFSGYVSTPPKRYLVSTQTITGSNQTDQAVSCASNGRYCEYHGANTLNTVQTVTFDDKCVSTTSCSGNSFFNDSGLLRESDNGVTLSTSRVYSSTYGADCQWTGTYAYSSSCQDGANESCSGGNSSSSGVLNDNFFTNFPLTYNNLSTTTTATEQTVVEIGGLNTSQCNQITSCACSGFAQSCSINTSHSITNTTTLSNEYTTALLKSNTVSALPDYSGYYTCNPAEQDPGCETRPRDDTCDPVATKDAHCADPCPHFKDGQGCTCFAYRNLSSDESSYTIQRFKVKFKGCGPATINYKEHFIPDNGDDPTDTSKTATISAGQTESAAIEVKEHTSKNGTTTITEVSFA